ncbi:thioesterase superfamily protein [Rhodococcus sp. SMB37]|uniref:PaaI family thioesterase n=1 Tax=Rhodococcus sp. SMB37 TaxID=2512213 RepID=UPI0010441B7D|nr:PaaI family thioesterase [Rhodococcus sp. SMB37]TCN53422.1 thioesterase superfamily protein [Rhodococcus sp. SMB37]
MQQIDENVTQERSHIADLPEEWLQTHRDLVASVRRLMHAAATTATSIEDLREAMDLVDGASDLAQTELRAGVLLGEFGNPEKVTATRIRQIGAHNPLCLPLEISVDGARASATLAVDALAEGPQGCLHGGLSAWLMDCMLGLMVESTGRVCVTAQLELRYLAPTPLHRPLDLHATVDSTEGRKVWVNSWIECDGTRTVEARGLFIEPRQ